MNHEMLRTDADNGVWECPSCPRKIVLTKDNFKVLEPGDPQALHFGTSAQGLGLVAPTVQPTTE